jgi:hypothetical protein
MEVYIMCKMNFFKGSWISLLIVAFVLAFAIGAQASMETRVLRGFLQKVDVKGGSLIVVVKTQKGGKTLDFKLEKGARVTFKGTPVDIGDFDKGSELLITYKPGGSRPIATDLRKIR